MKTIYFRNGQVNKISHYLALENYFLNETKEEVFFIWNIDKSIIIGKNQLLESEVNLEYAKKIGASVYRRPSGGGAIYADNGCFMFSFITRSINKEEVYRKYLGLIVEALKKIGIEVYFSGRNDLMFNNKKFSGNSFYSNKNGSVLHGTFLYNTNLEDLVKSITPDNEKLISKGIKSVRERVVNIGEYCDLTKNEIMNYLSNFISLEKIYLEDEDITKIKKIEENYLSDEWIYGNNPRFTYCNSKRFNYGKLEIFIDVNKNKVKCISLKGDFFEIKNIEEFYENFIGINFNKSEFEKVLENININNYILNSNNNDFINIIFEEANLGN